MIQNFKELWHFRELLLALTEREIKVRYKQTLLGASWAILQPGALTFIFTLVFGTFLHVQSGSIPYPIFSYSALLPWTFFSTATAFGSLSVVNNGNLVTKVYFPREILPLSSIGAAFFDFLMACIVIIPLFIYYKISFTVGILLLPLMFLFIVLFTVGIVFILSTVNVLFRDVRFIVPLLLQIWLFVTPVIYSSDMIPEKFRFILILNPLAPLIESFRELITLGKINHIIPLLVSCCISVMLFILGYWFFKNKEKIFADVI